MKSLEPAPPQNPPRREARRRERANQKELRLEADGETHRRDCECARCEAGFTPSERERELAGQRAAKKQGQLSAVRSAERRKAKQRLAQTELAAFFARGSSAVEAEIARLQAARAKAREDRRAEALLELRRQGWELGRAIAEIDRRFPSHAADNDNGHRQSPTEQTQLAGVLRDS